MQLVSDEYRKLNELLHEKNKNYGTSGVFYLDDVILLVKALQTQDVLDYGCGKGTLSMNLPFKIKQYDPAIKKYESLPIPADIVICTDVLEHIEPDHIDDVLKHIANVTKKMAYLVACNVKAQKTLPDGRNAHILLKPPKWWMEKIMQLFDIVQFHDKEGSSTFIVKPI